MKIRKDSVTNSSSTSYTCEISGKSETFYDGGDYRDYGFVVCTNEHVILEEFVIDVDLTPYREAMIADIKEFMVKYPGWVEFDEDEASIDHIIEAYLEVHNSADIVPWQCPLCKFDEVSQVDLKRYLLHEYGIPASVVFADVKSRNKRRKKLYNHEYIDYVLREQGLEQESLLTTLKERFDDYSKFREFCQQKTTR